MEKYLPNIRAMIGKLERHGLNLCFVFIKLEILKPSSRKGGKRNYFPRNYSDWLNFKQVNLINQSYSVINNFAFRPYEN